MFLKLIQNNGSVFLNVVPDLVVMTITFQFIPESTDTTTFQPRYITRLFDHWPPSLVSWQATY